MTTLVLSVIVPTHDATSTLERCLEALEASTLPRDRFEIIVVDDASEDATLSIAARYADTVIRLPDQPRGPAYARNRGAEIAAAPYLAFVDADVCVRPDTLARLVARLDERPDLAAVIGRYDADGAPEDLVSTYRNLRWHHLHGLAAGEVATFWAACGAIRADAFAAAGRFNEWHFSAPPVEDAELGRRLHARGLHVELEPALEVSHLRRWTAGGLLVRDCCQRGVRTARLLRRHGIRLATPGPRGAGANPPTELGLFIAASLVIVSTIFGMHLWTLAIVAAIVIVVESPFVASVGRVRGALFAVAMLPLHLLCELVTGTGIAAGWALRHLVGDPRPEPTVEALAEVGARTWPPLPTRL